MEQRVLIWVKKQEKVGLECSRLMNPKPIIQEIKTVTPKSSFQGEVCSDLYILLSYQSTMIMKNILKGFPMAFA